MNKIILLLTSTNHVHRAIVKYSNIKNLDMVAYKERIYIPTYQDFCCNTVHSVS